MTCTILDLPLFCLGGADLEMAAIRDLVTDTLGQDAVIDRRVGSGDAKASVYLADIRAALAAGRRPVLVELADDLPTGIPRDAVTFVDHHGPAVTALDAAFPGGWSGGDLPEQGFWGHGEPVPTVEALLGVLAAALPRCGTEA